jgi:hypothetical protein
MRSAGNDRGIMRSAGMYLNFHKVLTVILYDSGKEMIERPASDFTNKELVEWFKVWIIEGRIL